MYLRRSKPREEAAEPAEIPLRHTVADQLQLRAGQLAKRYVRGNPVVVGQRQQLFQLVRVGRRVPRCDGAIPQALARIGYDQVHVDVQNVAEPFARRTCAQRAVETQGSRFERRVVDATRLAPPRIAELPHLPRLGIDRPDAPRHPRTGRTTAASPQHDAPAASLGKGRLHGILHPRATLWPATSRSTSNQRLDFPRRIGGAGGGIFTRTQVDRAAVDDSTHKTVLLQLGRPRPQRLAGPPAREGRRPSVADHPPGPRTGRPRIAACRAFTVCPH